MTDEVLRVKIAALKGWNIAEKDAPNWPVDIAAAWELVEEMKQIGGAVCVEWATEFIDAPFKWWCGANVPQDYKVKPFTCKWHSGRADTAPRAICLAYIAWKEAQ
jgi:hypothetical protein